LGASAVAAAATDASLRQTERYAPSGPVIWPPQPFKETQRSELIQGNIWGLEQVIAFFTVSANIRMTVVRMKDSKLWVCGPISPTRECLRLLDELGEVGHLVVPGTSLEHKASLAEFSRIYPKASVWVAPGQNASPLDPSLGPRVDGVLGQTGSPPPWLAEIDAKVFYVAPPETAGTYAETAFFHRATRTLLLSDAVLKVPNLPPPVLASYGYEGKAGELTLEQWHYKFIAFNFLAMRGTNDADFQALAQPPGIVSPISRFTLYPICQQQAAAWVKSVADWPFEQVVAAHLQSPFRLTPAEFLDAFGFLFGKPSSYEPEAAQLKELRSAAQNLDGPEAFKSSIWAGVANTV